MIDEEKIDVNPSNKTIMELLTKILQTQQTMVEDMTEVKNRLMILENTTDNTQNEVNDLRESMNNGDGSKNGQHKRDSVLGSIAANGSSTKNNDNNSFLRVEPDTKHLKLKYLTVASAEKFWREIEEHERLYRGTKINAVDHIDLNVVKLLLAKAPRLQYHDFYYQQYDYIAGLIQEVLTPTDNVIILLIVKVMVL